MQTDLTLKNYRCFPDTNPARISVREGLTAFVGPNNSGKSALLRFFYEFRQLFGMLAQPGAYRRLVAGESTAFPFPPSVVDPTEVFCNTTQRDLEMEFHLSAGERAESQPPPAATRARLVITLPKNRNEFVGRLVFDSGPELSGSLGIDGTTLVGGGGARVADLAPLVEAFSILAKTLYIGAFRNVINIGSNEEYFDIKVGEAFVRAWRSLKTGPNKADAEAAYRLSRDIGSIFGCGDLQIDASEDSRTLQLLMNGKAYKLLEVGSGITQFILVLANAAIKKPSYILIDEPELNLHPSLQLEFLTTVASYTSHGILFGTHSIGLARAAADQIYSFRQVPAGGTQVRELEATPRLSEFIGELSFSGYRELGFDRLLLVEGRHDVKTIHQFLRLYGKDHKVVLLPLGGATLISEDCETELQEIKRISDNISVLLDSEREAPQAPLDAARQAFVDACQRSGISCHVLQRRAMENYFTDRAVKAVKGDKYQALEPYQALRDAALGWGKQENWRIAREMTRDELQDTDLGQVLSSL
jgi:energy-coupling factor transporter ATP-binding protein EcfA2